MKKVLKFGGSSVGSIDALLSVKRIVESQREACVVVVSALRGITDQLCHIAHQAAESTDDYLPTLREIALRHHEIIELIVRPEAQQALREDIDRLLRELGGILHGLRLIGELTPKAYDAIVSYGEQLSSLIVAKLIDGATHYDARQLIFTREEGGKRLVDFPRTNAEILNATAQISTPVMLMGGFIASDSQSGRTTQLGRGGSDYTAAIVAAAIDAEVLEIWTDVDGFMTADPRLVRNAYTIAQLSYREATELCNFGAKVIYPPTIFPVCAKEIPILVRNTFRPDAPHTVICAQPQRSERLMRGISSIRETALVTVSGLSMVGVIGVNRRIFATLAAHGVSVFMVAQLASESSTSLCVTPEDAPRACDLLNEEFAAEIAEGAMHPTTFRDDLSTIAVVGENMRHEAGVAGQIFSVLGRNGVSVCTTALGSPETSISFVIERAQLHKTLSLLHDSLLLSDEEVVNLFLCGTGTVGSKLLEQLSAQADVLLAERGIRFRLVGIGGSQRCLFDADGIDPAMACQRLAQSERQGGVAEMVRELLTMNLSNSVFVDCTASADVAAHYAELLEHNVNVVTANKIAASGNFDNYQRLKKTARQRGVKFLFETNVGAGLPIINTMRDLTASGDRIVGIEAVLSGTLNYVFNTLGADIPLSEAVRLAQENGYSEPDPRLDLSGIDVVRKITILARESGYRVETDDIEVRPFLPQELFEASMDEFWKLLPQLDADFAAERQRLAAEGKCWRFVAEWRNGKGSVGLKEIAQGHPLYDLEGSNNIVCLTTERYDAPMLIQGYGAGAAVTAAGVFGDLMRVANA